MEVQTIDEGACEHFRTLNQVVKGSAANSAAPTNHRLSNFLGNALDYFITHSHQVGRVMITEQVMALPRLNSR